MNRVFGLMAILITMTSSAYAQQCWYQIGWYNPSPLRCSEVGPAPGAMGKRLYICCQ